MAVSAWVLQQWVRGYYSSENYNTNESAQCVSCAPCC
jgi:hypothetical protein